jgi:capsular polysaccharide transport system permease protein
MGLYPKAGKKFNPIGTMNMAFRKTGLRFNLISFVALVVAPVFITIFYYAAIASDRYVSQAKVVVKMSGGAGGNKLELSLAGLGASGGQREPLFVRDYIHSFNMLEKVEKDLAYKTHITNRKIDIVSRLSSSATQEEFFLYYKDHTKIVFDPLSSMLTLEAEGFSREYAQSLLSAIIRNSELFLNEMSHQLAREQMTFVEKEMATAQEELRSAKKAINAFQAQHRMVSPAKQAEGYLGVVQALRTELVKEQTNLKGLESYLDSRALEVVQSRQKIVAIQKQVAIEEQRLTSGGANALTGLQTQFQDLEIDAEFALNKYKTALTGLETSRVEAYRKLAHLVVVESPTLPEEALYPRKLYNIATLFVVLSVIYGLVVMVAATIREHR